MNEPQRGIHLVPRADIEPELKTHDYARVTPGIYHAWCHRARIYFDRPYRRWVCLLVFDLIAPESGETIARGICMWLGLGTGERPSVSRRRKFFRLWVMANGGAPRRHDRMTHRVFLHRMAKVKVCDTDGLAPYSRVFDIVSWEGVAKTSGC